MANFDSKSFNEKAFKYSVEHPRVPNLKTNELKKSKVLKSSSDIRSVFSSQGGTEYARIAMKGLLDGDAVNYDGSTDILASTTKTFERGVIVIGRAKAWIEKDFSEDISGEAFMDNVADQVAEYKDGLDQHTLLSILKGIFAMSADAKSKEFVEKHTTDVSGVGDGMLTATTLNSATNKACGANKKKITLVFVHSDVATNIENLNLLTHLKYTDKDGITRDLDLGTWNGKLVVVDDDMPTEVVEATDTEEAYTLYTSYALGDGAFDYEDIGAKKPFEMDRDPKTNGGEDTLYMRQRKVFAPFGISYEKTSQASLSPTDAELEMGTNWALAHSGETKAADRSYINHKAIPIVKIVSKG